MLLAKDKEIANVVKETDADAAHPLRKMNLLNKPNLSKVLSKDSFGQFQSSLGSHSHSMSHSHSDSHSHTDSHSDSHSHSHSKSEDGKEHEEGKKHHHHHKKKKHHHHHHHNRKKLVKNKSINYLGLIRNKISA